MAEDLEGDLREEEHFCAGVIATELRVSWGRDLPVPFFVFLLNTYPHRWACWGIQCGMYHYNPSTALEELNEEAMLPNPVHVRDMMLRHKLNADEALELNRIFLEYQKFFGETQKLGREILKRLAA